MRKTFFVIFLLCFAQAYAKMPIPDELLNAKTAVVKSSGSEPKDFEKFCKLIKEWGRFEIVEDSRKADIIIDLSTELRNKTIQLPNTGGGFSGTANQQVLISIIHIFNAKSERTLWEDETPNSKDPKYLVSNLKSKMKDKEKEKEKEK